MMNQSPKAISITTLADAPASPVVVRSRLWQKGMVPPGAWMLGTTLFWSAVALSSPEAVSADISPERPPLPAMSLESQGPLSIWKNPANLGFDPDPAFSFLYGEGLGSEDTPTSLVLAGNAGPFGMGFTHLVVPGRPTWSAIATSLAIPMSEEFHSGIQLGWQIPNGPDNNFVTVDLGAGWRPLSWWGMSLVGYNLGVSGRHTGVEEHFAVGTTFRPADELIEISGAYNRYTNIENPVTGYAEATLKVQPIEGLTIRMSGDQLGTIGVGLEFGLGGGAIGAHTTRNFTNDLAPYAMVSVEAAPETGSLFQLKRQVPHVRLDQGFPYQPVNSFFFNEGESYLHMLSRLNDAATAQNTKALLIEIDWVPFSFAQIEEILSVFDRARANGKTIVAYLDQETSNAGYMLASGADHVFMNPAQQLMLVGLSAELMYFRETLDMVGVEPQFTRRSEYKSAAEPMTNTHASVAQQEQINALLDDLSGRLIARIAQGRNKSVADTQTLIDQGPFTADEAISHGLIDGVAYPDELRKKINEKIGKGNRYLEHYKEIDTHSGWRTANEIAVIFVEGVIASGESQKPGIFGGGRTAGAETILEQLKEASKLPSVGAIILRVDSPGGSALASDEIWRGVQEARRAGKPVIVSMGGVAASGGYYVAAGADAIFAQHSTVTGSIGVIAGKFSLAGLYEKIGINYETYIRGRNASMFSLSKPFDEHEFAAFDKMVGDIYAQFTAKVADGRNMEIQDVLNVAGGRVWSGTRAHGVKLVDEIGGFYEAVARARVEAKIPERAKTKLITFGGKLGPQEALQRMSVNMFQRSIFGTNPKTQTMPEIEMIRQLQAMGDDNVWALMPYNVEVH
jgi:protease IV